MTTTPAVGPRDLLGEAGLAAVGADVVPREIALCAQPGILLVADALPLMMAHGLDDFEQLARCDQGVRIKRSWLREVRRLGRPEGDGLFVKRYRAPSWWSCWRGALWHDRRGGLREWRNLWLLRRLGIASIEPLAYAEGEFGGEHLTVLVTRALPAVRDLEDEQVDYLPGPSDRAGHARKRRLIRQLAQLVRRLHAVSLFHRDLYLGHLRLDPHDADRLYLIDVQRMGPAWLAGRVRVKELAQLAYTSYPPFITRADRLRFLRLYAGRDRVTLRQLIRGVERRVLRMRRHQAKKRVRRVAREGRPTGVYFDRQAVCLEWCLDPRLPPSLLDPGGAERTIALEAGPGPALHVGDLRIELPPDYQPLAPATLTAKVLGSPPRRVCLPAQRGFSAAEIWRLGRAARALMY